jgi:hypothetical protein
MLRGDFSVWLQGPILTTVSDSMRECVPCQFQVKKLHAALKHGVFSATASGEDHIDKYERIAVLRRQLAARTTLPASTASESHA